MPTASYSKRNHLTLLFRGAEFFPALIDALDAAENEIYLETYIFASDHTASLVKAALMRAAARSSKPLEKGSTSRPRAGACRLW